MVSFARDTAPHPSVYELKPVDSDSNETTRSHDNLTREGFFKPNGLLTRDSSKLLFKARQNNRVLNICSIMELDS